MTLILAVIGLLFAVIGAFLLRSRRIIGILLILIGIALIALGVVAILNFRP